MGQLYRQALNIQHNSRILIGDQNRWRALRNNNCSGTNLTETKSCVLEMTKARVGGLAAVVAANGGNPNASPPAGAHIPYPPLSPAMTANPLSQPPAAPDQFKSSPQPQKNSAQTAAPRTSAAELSARQAHQQRIDDARALTAEQWAAPLQLITRIEIGYKCEVIDKLSADVAVMTVGSTMADQQIHNGLVGDTTMVVQQEMAKAIERGRLLFDKNSDQGFCSRFFSSPADRARLRQIVNDLMR